MGRTKQQLIDDAFGEIALANYDFDITPEEEQSALRRLDSMVATWAGQGVVIPYNFGDDISADSGLPLLCNEAAYLNLAIRIAAGKGKALAQSTKATAKQAFDSVLVWVAQSQLQEMQQRDGTPVGAGNKPWRTATGPFFAPPDTSPLQNDNSGLTFNGT